MVRTSRSSGPFLRTTATQPVPAMVGRPNARWPARHWREPPLTALQKGEKEARAKRAAAVARTAAGARRSERAAALVARKAPRAQALRAAQAVDRWAAVADRWAADRSEALAADRSARSHRRAPAMLR